MAQQPSFGQFIDTLLTHQDGAGAAMVNEKFEEVVSAVLSNHSKGSLTVTIDVKPGKVKDGQVEQVETELKIKASKPEAGAGKGLFFVNPLSHKLQRSKPNLQQELGLTEERS